MKNLRTVILDYPKKQIENPDVKTILGDVVQAKQLNFAATDANYVPMGGLDMVGTHFLIYDISSFLNPKLIFAIRTCYQDRAYRHNLELPIDGYSKWLPYKYFEKMVDFRKRKGSLVDVNAWFVDPSWSYKKSGLNLSEFGFHMVVLHILKRGFDHFVGTTNEKYKASRWVEVAGEFPKGMIYKHKFIDDPHLLILLENFNLPWFLKKAEDFRELYEGSNLYFPDPVEGEAEYKSDELVYQECLEKIKEMESYPLKRIS